MNCWTHINILSLSLSVSLIRTLSTVQVLTSDISFSSLSPLYKTFFLYSDTRLQLCRYIDSTWLGCLFAWPDNFGVLYFQGVTAYLSNKPQNYILVYNQYISHIKNTKSNVVSNAIKFIFNWNKFFLITWYILSTPILS